MGFWIQYKALLYKNWVLWKRRLFGSLCEIIMPLITMIVIGLLRRAIPPDYKDKQTFADQVDDSKEISYLNSDKTFKKCTNIYNEYTLYYSIISDDEDYKTFMIDQIGEVNSNMKGKHLDFDSAKDMEDYVTGSGYEDERKLCFVAQLEKDSTKSYKLKLRYNITETYSKRKRRRLGDFIEIFNLDSNPAYNDLIVSPTNHLSEFYGYGFLTLMGLTSNYLLRDDSHDAGFIKADMYPMRFDDYIEDSFLVGLGNTLVFLLIFSFLLPVCRFLSAIVQEKETRTKEMMMMMGLKSSAYWLSWITYYFCIYTVISILVTLIIVGMKVFTFSRPGLVFLYFWLFSMSNIAFSIFLSVFFSKSRSAVLIGVPVFIGSYFVSFAVKDPLMSMNKKAGASLLPCVAFSLATDVITNLEKGQAGMQPDNASYEITNYTHGLYFAMIIIDIVYLSLLAIYLEAVWPTEWGVKRKWYFLCSSDFWCRKKAKIDQTDLLKEKVVWENSVEPVDSALESQKQSGKAMIVRGLSKFFSNKVAVDGLNLDIYEGQIFALLGHNGAGKTTTISMLTGLIAPTQGEMTVHGQVLSKDLSKLREKLGVCPQQNILFPNLTPFEHMSLFCKFKGISDSKKIEEMSDFKLKELELTSKKDIQSKNLSGGQKRKLQLALALIGDSPIVLLDEPTSGMDLTARRHMWDMLKNNKNGRIIILTTHYMEEADVLADRIAIMSQGKLRCCGSSLFLKSRYGVGYYLTMVRDQESTSNTKELEEFVRSHVDNSKLMNDFQGEVTFQLPTTSSSQFNKFFETLDSMFKSFGLLSYSMSATTLEEVFLRVARGDDELKKGENHELGKENSLLLNENNFKLEKDKQPGNLFFKHFKALIKKRALATMRDKKTLFFEIFIPIILIIIGLSLMMIPGFLKEYNAYELKVSQYSKTQKVYYGGDSSGFSYITSMANIDAVNSETLQIEDFSDFVFDHLDKQPKIVNSYFINSADDSSRQYHFTIINDQKAFQSYPTALGSITETVLQEVHGSDFSIKYYNHPLPNTDSMLKASGTGDGFIGSLIFGLGFSFIPTGIVLFITKERENNVKHQHMISGVSLSAYWISNLVWDLIKHIIPAIVCSLMILAFQVDIYNNDKDDYGAMWVLIVLGGVCEVPFSYMISFFFKSHSNAQIVTLIMSFVTGSVLPSAVYVMHIFKESRNAGVVISWILRIFPNFCFGWGVLNVGAKQNFAVYFERKDPFNSFDVRSAGGCMIMMGVIFVAYFGIVILLELFESNPAFAKCIVGKKKVAHEQYELDEDVKREANTANETDPKDVQVNVKSVSKCFKVQGKIFAAVNHVSFNVNPEECFALLGVNGAGKTTLFKILTGELFSDHGSAHVGGFSVSKELSLARTLIGYCPQFDAISELLTGFEHLVLYAHIKGIPNDKVQEQAEYMLKNMDLTQYRDILAGTYSGGNKRKLSVAMALIGNPSVVFLDEPSAGMDPEARKKMWKILGRIKKQKSAVILTTHSMEEAEALCDRMTIMVRGRLKCIGTSTWIKNKFGDGYELEVKVEPPQQEDILNMCRNFGNVYNSHLGINFDTLGTALENASLGIFAGYIRPLLSGASIYNIITSEGYITSESLASWCLVELLGVNIFNWLVGEFGTVEVIEHYHLMFRFKIKKQVAKSIGYLFSIVEQKKSEFRISDYAVSMTSLEQIFNGFAKRAELEEAGLVS
jgi:ATP-binding cassette subfamily A (ABC1) protein 3